MFIYQIVSTHRHRHSRRRRLPPRCRLTLICPSSWVSCVSLRLSVELETKQKKFIHCPLIWFIGGLWELTWTSFRFEPSLIFISSQFSPKTFDSASEKSKTHPGSAEAHAAHVQALHSQSFRPDKSEKSPKLLEPCVRWNVKSFFRNSPKAGRNQWKIFRGKLPSA